MAENYSNQLDGLILGEILTNLKVLNNSTTNLNNNEEEQEEQDSEKEEEEDELNTVKIKLGLKTNKNSFTRESIFKNTFEDDPYDNDDDDQDQEGGKGDLESQVDKEMYNEKYGKSTIGINSTTTTTSSTTITGSRTLRGEDENYSDEDEEEDTLPTSNSNLLPSTITTITTTIIIKPEPTSPSSTSSFPLPLPLSLSLTHSTPPPEEEEEDRYKPPTTPTIITPPKPLNMNLKTLKNKIKVLFPNFIKGNVLDFTELFSGVGSGSDRVGTGGDRKRDGSILGNNSSSGSSSKRLKLNCNPLIPLSLPTLETLPRSKSTRDVLSAPLRLQRRTRNNIRLKELGLMSGGSDGGGSEELLNGIEIDNWMNGRRDIGQEEDDDEELLEIIERSTNQTKSKWLLPSSNSTAFSAPELETWESKIIWDRPASNTTVAKVETAVLAPRNSAFESGDWLNSIIWDNNSNYKEFTKVELNLNDVRMNLEIVKPVVKIVPLVEAPITAKAAKDAPTISTVGLVTVREEGLDPFNFSNDKEYAVTKDTKKKIRQTFGLLEVQHAYPAQKLQLPFYKTRLSKSDARSFHRPALQFTANIPIGFTKVRSKKKKDKAGKKSNRGGYNNNTSTVGNVDLRGMSDITLKDLGNFVLWEYSEENPPIISNVGMGSILVNYYRKKDATDDFIPQLELGEPFLLEPNDESPFKAFGSVEPGQTVPTLYNNLVRAPLFQHKAADTDFLIIRVTIDGEVKYYIREIKHNFVIGQTYPLLEVPGPHSRKISNLMKNRLQTIAFKLIHKNPNLRIKVHRLTRYFPDQNDLQMRQRLKEFMEFNRTKGIDQGFWSVKKSIQIPDEAEMLKRATPEDVCLAESMQVGVRHLSDAGYGQTTADDSNAAGDDESKLDIEQQLAPWHTTKNFINATANKAMLKLFGEGDPTGRGEAFSFLRVSMKDIFLRDGEEMATRLAQMENRPKSAHRYNVQEQQDVYKEEINRIWKLQSASLSDPIEPQLTQEDEDRQRGRKNPNGGRGRRGGSTVVDTPMSNAGTPAFNKAGSVGSRDSSPDRDGMSDGGGKSTENSNKILRIRRKINDKWETEVVRDPNIISAYLRQRRTIDEEATDADDLRPSDDEGKNERRRKRLKEQLDKLKRNQERRLTRKNQKLGITAGSIGAGRKVAKAETTRVCGNCGKQGHMKTSRKLCPRWAEFNAPKAAEPTGALPTAFTGGLALPSMTPAPAPTPVVVAPVVVPKSSLKFKLSAPIAPPLGSSSTETVSMDIDPSLLGTMPTQTTLPSAGEVNPSNNNAVPNVESETF